MNIRIGIAIAAAATIAIAGQAVARDSLTGTIIGISRALGETAPLLMIGMVAFITTPPESAFTDQATALPVQIYMWANEANPAFIERTSAAIVIVTHSMQQAARVSQQTAFFHLGFMAEFGETAMIFTNPDDKRTQDCITGRFG